MECETEMEREHDFSPEMKGDEISTVAGVEKLEMDSENTTDAENDSISCAAASAGSTVATSLSAGSNLATSLSAGSNLVTSPSAGSNLATSPSPDSTAATSPSVGLTVVTSPSADSSVATSPSVGPTDTIVESSSTQDLKPDFDSSLTRKDVLTESEKTVDSNVISVPSTVETVRTEESVAPSDASGQQELRDEGFRASTDSYGRWNSENIPMETEETTATADAEENYFKVEYNFTKSPVQVTGSWKEFQTGQNTTNNFLKGCKWSPDGSCILTNSDDNVLRLFNLPNQLWTQNTEGICVLESVLKMNESSLVYDYNWYPLMSSDKPETCCIVSTSRDTPIHLWDAFYGDIRASYRIYDQADELVHAHSVAFSLLGDKLYCGGKNFISVFDTNRPGRECTTRRAKQTGAMIGYRQTGILSCIAASPSQKLLAIGSYSKTVGLYTEDSCDLIGLMQGVKGGVTHVQFSPDGTKLYSGGRKDTDINCWDVRQPGIVLYTLQRQVETSQRIYFDIDRSGNYLVSGNHDGSVHVWDLNATSETSALPPINTFNIHSDTVNGVSLHPYLPLLATSSGQRHLSPADDSDDDDSDSEEDAEEQTDNSLRFHWIQ
ncbi:telomerase Cajal body protein 1-like [Tubulanus polymorphus]|uniref:telomerase Cajal body protein 1-like n=1 Tax=Tubulanus polymorphus TaxID=672921 RepID=UPI003DA47995